MAARTTAKVATLTGAAKDDLLGGLTEDGLVSDLDVLANDPGAARMWSLDQGVPALPGGTQVPSFWGPVALASGANISVNPDGTIHYDGSAMNLQSLAQGESFTDTFIYTARMANGALSTATASVQVAGANDAPTLIAPDEATIADSPDQEAQATIGDGLAGSDVDNGAVLTYSLAAGSSDYGTIVVNADGTWSFTDDPAKLDALGAGATATATFQAVVTDEHGASSAAVDIVVHLIGANDIAEATDDEASVTEDSGSYTVSGSIAVADRDAGESAFAAVGDLDGSYGVFTFSDGAWSYTLDNDNADVNALDAGEMLTETLVIDSFDHTAQSTITVTIHGADDPTPPADDGNEGGPEFLVNWGRQASSHNVFFGFGGEDTLYYVPALTWESVALEDRNADGSAGTGDSVMDTVVYFEQGGHGNTVEVVLVGYADSALVPVLVNA
ncbi:MAG: VCBS domain-containing protein [Ramlibacter sp.]|nr:VCBS domain-containing protein [Ramlibacter sp.]